MTNPLHHTMVAATPYTFTFDRAFPRVEVCIYEAPGTSTVWFRTDGTTPAADTDGSNPVPALLGAAVEVVPVNHAVVADGPTVTSVIVITAGTPKVSVRGLT